MSGIFGLAAYADYHRDKRTCAFHITGNPLLFLAALLSLLSVTAFGFPTTPTAILTIPALTFWTVLDFAIGAAIACAVIPLFVALGFRRDLAAFLSGLATDKAPCAEHGRRW